MKCTLKQLNDQLHANVRQLENAKAQAIQAIKNEELEEAADFISKAMNVKKSIVHIKRYEFDIDWSERG